MADNEHALRYVETNSMIHRTYPLIKVAWVFLVAISLFIFREPVSGLIMFLAVLMLTLVLARVPLHYVLNSSLVIVGIGILLMGFHFFSDQGNPLYKIGPLTITDTGWHDGPVYFFRLATVVLASFALIWTTDIRDLMVSLTKIGIPYRYAFAVFLASRFLPLIQREVDAVQAAHSIRGRAARSSLMHRIRLIQRYMFTVLINGLRKAEATATAIESRGFGAYKDRTYVKEMKFNPVGLLLVIVFAALISALVYLESTGMFI